MHFSYFAFISISQHPFYVLTTAAWRRSSLCKSLTASSSIGPKSKDGDGEEEVVLERVLSIATVEAAPAAPAAPAAVVAAAEVATVLGLS